MTKNVPYIEPKAESVCCLSGFNLLENSFETGQTEDFVIVDNDW